MRHPSPRRPQARAWDRSLPSSPDYPSSQARRPPRTSRPASATPDRRQLCFRQAAQAAHGLGGEPSPSNRCRCSRPQRRSNDGQHRSGASRCPHRSQPDILLNCQANCPKCSDDIQAGITLVHVPYRGDAVGLTDTISGQGQATFSTVAASLEYVRTGKLRALGVTTATRWQTLPDVPTIGEIELFPGVNVFVMANMSA
jgi:Tripartite tricarboxylate transporter family receptor